ALAERRGYRRIMSLGAALIVAAFTIYLSSPTVPRLGAARLLTGFGEALIFTAGGAWVLALASAERRGRVISMFGLALWIGATVGPLIGEALARRGGLGAVALGGMLLAALSGASVLSLDRMSVSPAGEQSVPLFPRAVLRPGATFTLTAFGYAALST